MGNATFDFVEHEHPIHGETGSFTLRYPKNPAPNALLLINLAKDRKSTLNEPPYCIVSDLFVGEGHYAASFDLPNHGDNVNEHGEGLTGMAAAISAGVDVFAAIRNTARRVIQVCIDLKIIQPRQICITGTSRGGLAALHVMADYPQVAAAAVFAPVTDLPFLREFADLSRSQIIRNSNAESLIPLLRGRPVFTSIGPDDLRVGTAQCERFHSQLASSADSVRTVFDLDDQAKGHRTSDKSYRMGARFLLESALRL